jgi:hypothetical protein
MRARDLFENRPGLLPGIIFLILISVSPAICETIYQWKNEREEGCYSNISPPGEACDYRVITVGRGAVFNMSPVTDASVVASSPELSAAASRLPRESSPKSVARLLNERITNRKNEISAMEQLLKKQAIDEGLRRSLLRKKRYLAEDLIYWAELNP